MENVDYRLNSRERRLLKRLIAGDSLSKAGLAAGYSEKAPKQGAYQAFQSIKRKIPDIMERIGFSNAELVTKYLRPALEAMETEFAKEKGKITDSVDVVAWGPRLQALDMAFKLTGAYAEPTPSNINNNFLIMMDAPRPAKADE